MAELVDHGVVTPPISRLSDVLTEHPPLKLRSLDAIHLASARVITSPASPLVLCGYDDRLQSAGRSLGLLAISPGR